MVKNVGDLIKYLRTFDKNLPVYIGVYVNRTPYDGEGTDLSCYEPYPFNEKMMTQRTYNVGMDKEVKEPHIYIQGSEY
jgi:hypothetical protein